MIAFHGGHDEGHVEEVEIFAEAPALAVGGVGFSMGATANGLAVMQGLSEKYGSNARAWLIVSLVGAFLIDLINALLVTWMGAW